MRKKMAHYRDFSEYCYGHGTYHASGTVNIGWLGASLDFEQMDPEEGLLDLVWDYCKISVAQYRGIHGCEYCHPRRSDVGERHGEMRLLGSAEIRVFAPTGAIYAAPDLMYHYMTVHRYKPPDQFISALQLGPHPFSKEYANRLAAVGLTWKEKTALASRPKRFRFEKTPTGVTRIELDD
jgi:hypothetical protein